MLNTVWAIVKEGKIVTLSDIAAPEGTKAIVTLMYEDDTEFWQRASQQSLSKIWENEEDDIYAELLAK